MTDCPGLQDLQLLLLSLLALLFSSCWALVLLTVSLAVREARRQKQSRVARALQASKDGGIALVLAGELHDRWNQQTIQQLFLLSLYLTEKMLSEHEKFRSMYDRIPADYPDAYTINRAKKLQEERLFEFFSEDREVECLIKKLFRQSEGLEEKEERLEYEDPVLWDAHIDVIKRRMSKLRPDQPLSLGLTTDLQEVV